MTHDVLSTMVVVVACQDLPLICIGSCNPLDFQLLLQDITAPTFSSARRPHTRTQKQAENQTHIRPGTSALLQATRIAPSPSSLHDPHCPHHFRICSSLNKTCKTVRSSRRIANRSCPNQRGCPCSSISASSPPTTSECNCPTIQSNTPQISACHNRRRRSCRRPLLLPRSPAFLTLRHLLCGSLNRTSTALEVTSRTEKAFEAVSAAASLSQRLHTPIHQTLDHLNRPP